MRDQAKDRASEFECTNSPLHRSILANELTVTEMLDPNVF